MLAYLDGEPAAQQVRQVLRKARNKHALRIDVVKDGLFGRTLRIDCYA